jgi:hypothetical protein
LQNENPYVEHRAKLRNAAGELKNLSKRRCTNECSCQAKTFHKTPKVIHKGSTTLEVYDLYEKNRQKVLKSAQNDTFFARKSFKIIKIARNRQICQFSYFHPNSSHNNDLTHCLAIPGVQALGGF